MFIFLGCRTFGRTGLGMGGIFNFYIILIFNFNKNDFFILIILKNDFLRSNLNFFFKDQFNTSNYSLL